METQTARNNSLIIEVYGPKHGHKVPEAVTIMATFPVRPAIRDHTGKVSGYLLLNGPLSGNVADGDGYYDHLRQGAGSAFAPDGDMFHAELEYIDEAGRDPMCCAGKIFGNYLGDGVKHYVMRWMHTTLASRRQCHYLDVDSIRKLMRFCLDIQHLYEALYLLSGRVCSGKRDGPYGVSGQPFCGLTQQEWDDPVLVLQRFCGKYSWRHSRTELWHLLHNAVAEEPEARERHNHIWRFQELAGLLKTAYHYLQQCPVVVVKSPGAMRPSPPAVTKKRPAAGTSDMEDIPAGADAGFAGASHGGL